MAAALVVVAFFLPWMNGSNELSYRSFSGFDFARLVRNFEITAGSESTAGQIRLTALAIYLVPALAVNGAALRLMAVSRPSLRRASGLALGAGGAYALLLLASILLLSLVPVNDFAGVVRLPSYGLALSALGAVLLGWLGSAELRDVRRAGTAEPTADKERFGT